MPATIAVIKPLSGVVPLAIANAIANGNATIATVSPAIESLAKSFAEYPSRNTVTNFGSHGEFDLRAGLFKVFPKNNEIQKQSAPKRTLCLVKFYKTSDA